MSLEINGTFVQIGPTVQASEKFKKREFVIEITEEINGNIYSNFAKMQLTQAKCDILDNYKLGEKVIVKFNLKGNKYERDGKVNYITNLDAWRIERVGGQHQAAQAPQQYASSAPPYTPPQQQNNFPAGVIDDLPF